MNIYTPENFDALLIDRVNRTPKLEISFNQWIDALDCSERSAPEFIAMLREILEKIPEPYRAETTVVVDDDAIEFRVSRTETDDEHIERCRAHLAREVNAKHERWKTYQRLKREFEEAPPKKPRSNKNG